MIRDDGKVPEIVASMTIHDNETNTTQIEFGRDVETTENASTIKMTHRMTNKDALLPINVSLCIDDIKQKGVKRIVVVVGAENVLKLSLNLLDVAPLVVICENPNDSISSIQKNTKQNSKELKKKPFDDQYLRGTRMLSEQSAQLLWYDSLPSFCCTVHLFSKTKVSIIQICYSELI